LTPGDEPVCPSQSLSAESRSPRRIFAHLIRAILLVVILVMLASFWMRPRADPTLQFTGPTMGTFYSVTCVLDRDAGEDGNLGATLAAEIEACLEQVNSLMSTYRPDSELSRLNGHVEGTPFPVSPPLLHVLGRAIEISKQTHGAFDVTVGPLVNVYGFGPQDGPVTLPTDAELDRLKTRVGYQMVELDAEAGAVTKGRPDLYIDLSAIAKGYAVDRVAAILDAHGVANYLVEVGGEIRVRGHNVEGHRWKIGVEKPTARGRAVHRVLALTDTAMATSGDYRNYYLKDGLRISHTIDPRTARPVAHKLASVTVLCEDCETADALATALMVLGPDEGYNLAENRGIVALFLVRQGADSYLEKVTSAFASATLSSASQDRTTGKRIE